MTDFGAVTRRACPECGAAVEADPRAPTWCAGCDWGLDPRGLLAGEESKEARRAEQATRRLMRRVVGGHERRWTWRDVAARVLATAVLAGWVMLGVLGVAAFFLAHPLFWLFGAGLVAGMVWLRPRPVGGADDNAPVDRMQAPHLDGLVADVAAAVGIAAPSSLEVAAITIVATAGRARAHGRVVLRIGAPLWGLLDGQARVAALAAELARAAGHDPRRRGVVAVTSRSLRQWAGQLGADYGGSGLDRPADQLVFVDPLASAQVLGRLDRMRVMRAADKTFGQAIAAVLGGTARVLDRLTFAPHQRAELQADAMAVRVAGTAGMEALLDTLPLAPRAASSVAQAVHRVFEDSIIDTVAEHLGQLPDHEHERLARIVAREPVRRGATHPPVRIRRELVTGLPRADPSVVLDTATAEAVDAELATAFRPLETRLRAAAQAKAPKTRHPG